MSRRISYLLVACVFAQLSSGCCLFERVAYRIRNFNSCVGCYPHFNTPGGCATCDSGPVYGAGVGMGGYGMSYGGYGGGDCASCQSGYAPAQMSYGPVAPAVTLPGAPSVGLPMPAGTTDKK